MSIAPPIDVEEDDADAPPPSEKGGKGRTDIEEELNKLANKISGKSGSESALTRIADLKAR
eukprot:12425019-Karenia_brevis.AAC.1